MTPIPKSTLKWMLKVKSSNNFLTKQVKKWDQNVSTVKKWDQRALWLGLEWEFRLFYLSTEFFAKKLWIV